MFRKGERNNWGVLLAWSFYLSDSVWLAMVSLLIVDIFLWVELSKKEKKQVIIRSLFLIGIYHVIMLVNPYVKSFLFLSLLAINLACYFPFVQKGKIAFEDVAIWLLVGFSFYLVALSIPFFSFWAGIDSFRVFFTLALLFLPHAFLYVLCELWRKERNSEMTFLRKNVIHYR